MYSFSYLSLAFICFLSSTIVPLGSEAFVIGFILHDFNPYLVLTIATIANTLGSLTSYAIAYFGLHNILDKFFKKSLIKAKSYQTYINKYGICLAFFYFFTIYWRCFCLSTRFLSLQFNKKYNFYQSWKRITIHLFKFSFYIN